MDKKHKHTCPLCGEHEFSVEHPGGSTNTFLLCTECGYKGTEKAWKLPIDKLASGTVQDKTRQPSDKPSIPNDPNVLPTQTKYKKNRLRPEKRLMHDDPEQIRGVGRISSNPFVIKTSYFKSHQLNPNEKNIVLMIIARAIEVYINRDPDFASEKGNALGLAEEVLAQLDNDERPNIEWLLKNSEQGDRIAERLGHIIEPLLLGRNPKMAKVNESKKITGKNISKSEKILKAQDEEIKKMTNPFITQNSENDANPFVKQAREFRRSEWGEERKQDSADNMVFPEGKQEGSKGKGSSGNSDVREKGYTPQETIFDTIDRKEYRSSPKARDIIPGQAEWEDNQVDKFYDGWVNDHIENSGGKIVGSNTEHTMNLNDGEHAHTPRFPEEAVYEKLLESRHNFDGDYARVVAENGIYHITKKAAQSIAARHSEEDTFISHAALKIIKTLDSDGNCPDCKKKTLANQRKSQYLFHEILI